MNCNSNATHANSCSCHSSFMNNPNFWSNKKKIRMLGNLLDCLREQEKEVEEAINELKTRK